MWLTPAWFVEHYGRLIESSHKRGNHQDVVILTNGKRIVFDNRKVNQTIVRSDVKS